MGFSVPTSYHTEKIISSYHQMVRGNPITQHGQGTLGTLIEDVTCANDSARHREVRGGYDLVAGLETLNSS